LLHIWLFTLTCTTMVKITLTYISTIYLFNNYFFFCLYLPKHEIYFLTKLVNKVKPNINSIEIHSSMSNNGHPIDGALVGVSSLWPYFMGCYRSSNNALHLGQYHCFNTCTILAIIFFLVNENYFQNYLPTIKLFILSSLFWYPISSFVLVSSPIIDYL
jgi:hypothetical protein